MVILETPRLLLRQLVPEDLDPLFALYGDPEIRQYFPDGTRTLEETRQELEWFLHGHKLTIRQDSGNSARPYADGALLAIRKASTLVGVHRGLDSVLDL